MSNFEVNIFAREIIKPSSPKIHGIKPFKLTIFDQLTPTTYMTIISFYSVSGTGLTPTTILPHLKASLSETLNILYPFSGRIKDNMFVERFDQGVPFLTVRANCSLSEFLKHHETESLNKLLPCQPFLKESNDEVPLLLLQVTIFACGGISLAFAVSHKIFDAHTYVFLGKIWSSICRGSHLHNAGFDGLGEASMVFPPRNQVTKDHLSTMENLWFPESEDGCNITKRFIFDAKSIAKLRAIAKGELEATPSRVQALSGFIWKRSMEATRTISGSSSKPSILVQAVNLRTKKKPTLLPNSIGNALWWASYATNLADQTNTELFELVEMMRESVAAFDEEYLDSIQGEEGFEVIGGYIDQLETLFSSEKPDIFGFTSWCNLGFYELDFGWGKPTWVAPFGEVGSGFRSHAILAESKCGKGIEAWITLDEKRMSVLEKDGELLKFASPYPKISNL